MERQASDVPQESLRCAINLSNAAIAQPGHDGHPEGICVELAKLIAARLQLRPEFILCGSASQVLEKAEKRQIDIGFIAADRQRESIVKFTQPYIVIEGAVLVPANSSLQSTIDIDHDNVMINVGKGAAIDLWLTRSLKNANLHRLSSSQEAIDMFMHGQGDMVAGVLQALEPIAEQDSRFRLLSDSFTRVKQAICVPAGDDRYFPQVQQLMEEIRENGTLAHLIEQYVRHP